jgi:hypothetical protein
MKKVLPMFDMAYKYSLDFFFCAIGIIGFLSSRTPYLTETGKNRSV